MSSSTSIAEAVAPSYIESRVGRLSTCVKIRVFFPGISAAEAWVVRGANQCLNDKNRARTTIMNNDNECDFVETTVSIERVLEDYIASAPRVSHADIKRLCENLSGYLRETPAFRRSSVDIIKAIRAGSPAMFGESIIGSSVIGPVAMYNVATTNGLIYGCGAICFADPDDIPDGAIVHLRHGLIVTSVEDIEKCIVGWVRADDGMRDPDADIQGVEEDTGAIDGDGDETSIGEGA